MRLVWRDTFDNRIEGICFPAMYKEIMCKYENEEIYLFIITVFKRVA